jgi:hypothetical protein
MKRGLGTKKSGPKAAFYVWSQLCLEVVNRTNVEAITNIFLLVLDCILTHQHKLVRHAVDTLQEHFGPATWVIVNRTVNVKLSNLTIDRLHKRGKSKVSDAIADIQTQRINLVGLIL